MNVQNTSSSIGNSETRFGSVAKVFHWLTAFLILSMLVLGIVASKWPFDTSDSLATKGFLFSIHKTLGLFTFFVASLRISWAIIQPRPAALPIDSKLQQFAAETVHWALYGALVLVPLTGWTHHAATTGFAPIFWPFGQTLFFVPQSLGLAAVLGKLHLAFNIVLFVSLGLHIAGALKHHVIDRDATLKRMLPGRVDLPAGMIKATFHKGPALAAFCIWVVAAGIGITFGLAKGGTAKVAALETVQSEWSVSEGTLAISVDQFGQTVEGTFSDWTAEINFSETPTEGQYGDVSVVIGISSLTLGSVTNEALAADFLNVEGFNTATYSGAILGDTEGYIVDGTLTLVGQSVPLVLPFTLDLDGGNATAQGETALDRRDFGIGQAYPDEGTVGFNVGIAFDLVATLGGGQNQ